MKLIRRAACLAGSAFFVLAIVPRAQAQQLVERIVARVNNEIITQRQYDQQLETLKADLGQHYSGAELEKAYDAQKKNALRDMIDQDLLVEKAKDDGISAETEVVKELDQIRQQQGLKSLDDLQKAVEENGLDWEDFKDNIRRQILVRKVIEQDVEGRIIVSHAEAKKYFEDHLKEFNSPPGVELAEILVSTQKHSQQDAQKLAQQAYNALQTGVPWKEAVTKYSDGPQNQDGDIGFIKQGTLAAPIEAKIKALAVDEYTKPFQTQYGSMIVKVLMRRTGAKPTFDQVSQRVMNYVYNMKTQQQLRDYLLQLREESYIRLAPGFVDTGAPPRSVEAKEDFPEEQ